MKDSQQIESIASEDLAHVTGGARHAAAASWNPFGFLEGAYKKLVFHFAGDIGGNKLAEKMYGSRVNAGDRARSKAAMHQFLAGGNKLPKGVPNLFA